MAKNSKTKPRAKGSKAPDIPGPNQGKGKTLRIYVFIVLFLLGIFSITALISYDKNQDIFFAESLFSNFVTKGNLNGSNACGAAGATFSMLSFNFLGIASFLIPVFLFLFSYYMFHVSTKIALLWKFILCVVALCAGTILLCTFPDGFYEFFASNNPSTLDSCPHGPGGLLGELLHSILSAPLGVAGTVVISLIVFLVSAFALIFSSPLATLRTLWAKLVASNKTRREAREEAKLLSDKEKEKRRLEAIEVIQAARNENSAFADPDAQTADDVDPLFSKVDVDDSAVNVDATSLRDLDSFQPDLEDTDDVEETEPETKPEPEPATETSGDLEVNVAETMEEADAEDIDAVEGDYVFPPLDLLAEPSASELQGENYQARGEEIISVLKQFGREATLSSVQVGPTITRYEITPGPGVRAESIINLQNNVAMGIHAQSARLCTVPEHGTIGIEVPNKNAQPVPIREILASKSWQEARAKMGIPAVLGKDVTGKPVLIDIAKMPHGLIAGSSGSGKSVCLNGLITSILYNASPQEVRLVMVDPKVVELRVYNDAPHMLLPVITDMKRAAGALKWLIDEMEDRYKLLEKAGVRNIDGFNKKIALPAPKSGSHEGSPSCFSPSLRSSEGGDHDSCLARAIGASNNCLGEAGAGAEEGEEEADCIGSSSISLPGCGAAPHSLSLSKGGDHDVCPALAGNKHLGEDSGDHASGMVEESVAIPSEATGNQAGAEEGEEEDPQRGQDVGGSATIWTQAAEPLGSVPCKERSDLRGKGPASRERGEATQPIEVPRDEGVLDELATHKKLPYIVCIIDEYADIMAQNAAEIETNVARLTAKARAAGIHLILATQRPDAKTVTGLIKSNLGTRIALRVTSGTNSRIILDEVGAETLIGRGDMLILGPGSPELQRAQGVWVSEDEIENIVNFLAEHNGKPKYSESVTAAIDKIVAAAEEKDDGGTISAEGANEDTLCRMAFEVMVQNPKRASISYLQRKFSIGYGKAANVMDRLEELGYVGESLGPNKPREILKSVWEN